jgi:hypothetical protein
MMDEEYGNSSLTFQWHLEAIICSFGNELGGKSLEIYKWI